MTLHQYRNSELKIIFAGTPDYAAGILSMLLQAHQQVVAVYTQPDRPAGRGQLTKASPVKALALAHQIPCFQPVKWDEFEQQRVKDFNADVMVVTAYGMLLPKTILEIFPYGAINVHPSLLPRWRGATPIQSAILAGDAATGVSIMQMTPKMDAGPVLLQKTITIQPGETSGQLHDRLMTLGGEALLEILTIPPSAWQSKSQDETLLTYSKKIQKSDARINWQFSARQISQMIRAFNPWPVAVTDFKGDDLRIWQGEPLPERSTAPPGLLVAIHKDHFDVATGEGVLQVWKVQFPGKQPAWVKDFINAQGKYLIPGVTCFGIGKKIP